MQRAIELSKQIRKDLSKNWLEELEDYNLHKIFEGVYSFDISQKEKNIIICFIIYSYDPDSIWLDIYKDRSDNKKQILENLGADINSELFEDVLNNRNEKIGIYIFNFLEQLKNWKWTAISNYLDYAERVSRFATQSTDDEKHSEKLVEGVVKKIRSDIDIDMVSKVEKEKGFHLDQSVAKRRQADELLKEIKTEFIKTDEATQGDFGFQLTETAKKKDITCWRTHIKELNEKK